MNEAHKQTQSPKLAAFAMSEADRAEQQKVFEANTSARALFADNPRLGYAAICALTPLAKGVEFAPVSEPEVTGWWATPTSADQSHAILFIHGGGYGVGDAESYRGLMSQIAIRTNCPVLGVDYPLAPEHPFPAAYDAVGLARDWLVGRGIEAYALMGDSAGGGICLALLSAQTSAHPPASVVVFSPWTDLALTGNSFHDPHTYDPIFKPEYLAMFARAYLGGADPMDKRASPLHGIPNGIPPLLVQVGTNELLLDDSTRYANSAADQGADVTLELYEGLHHVFQRDAGRLSMANKALDQVAGFIKKHW